MSLNKKIIYSSLAGIAICLMTMYSVSLNFCEKTDYECRTYSDKLEHILYFVPVILFFSLITYKLKPEAFSAWWRFARIAIPVVFLGLFVISLELHHNPGGWFNIDNEKDLVMYFVIYTIFIIGSFIQIYRGYKK
jgi:cytochrome bd-type quinol oxidase subunit 2